MWEETCPEDSNDRQPQPQTFTKRATSAAFRYTSATSREGKLCYGITVSSIVLYINSTTGWNTLRGSSLYHFHICGDWLVEATNAVKSLKTSGFQSWITITQDWCKIRFRSEAFEKRNKDTWSNLRTTGPSASVNCVHIWAELCFWRNMQNTCELGYLERMQKDW